MSGLHSLSVEQSHRDAVLGGDFVGAGFVQAIGMACVARVYNDLAVVGWFEGRN